MIVKTIVPKLGEEMHYLGKPVTNKFGVRIGSIVDVENAGDCWVLNMDIQVLEFVNGMDVDGDQ